MAKRKYFPNKWNEYKNAPDEMFIPHTYEELMAWKVRGWELPSSVFCVIRTKNLTTKKVTENVYQQRSAAQRKVTELIHTPDIEFCVVDHQNIHHLFPRTKDNDEH